MRKHVRAMVAVGMGAALVGSLALITVGSSRRTDGSAPAPEGTLPGANLVPSGAWFFRIIRCYLG